MFDKVIKPNATQEKVYNDAARTIVKGKEAAAGMRVSGGMKRAAQGSRFAVIFSSGW